MSPLNIGEFRLLSSAVPQLTAGRYRARLEQTVTQGGTINPVERHLNVTAPQFSLPGTEVQSVFPPPNAVGGFDTRLAQVVLKRRTLPWERKLSPSSSAPWLALVLLTEAEGKLVSAVPVTEVIPTAKHATLGVTVSSGTCDCLETTPVVVSKVFPRADELPLLCHVREVSLADTELAGGDLDGYVSVVLGNRVPRGGVTYGAYLISLEERADALPASTGTPVTTLGSTEVVPGGGDVRFPVLAHWSFTCSAGGDFQSIMENLDVGSFGTVGSDGCPGVTPTGHAAIAHRTRRGEQGAAWYRGPVTPREVARRDAGTPYFHADQARAIASDGFEDLSEAAAFELGRLLAMSDPRFLAALMEWRRTTMANDAAAESLDRVPGATDLGLEPGTVGRGLGKVVVSHLSGPNAPLGTRLPLVDVSAVVSKQDFQIIGKGLGIDPKVVEAILVRGVTDIDLDPAPPQDPLVGDFDTLRNNPTMLDFLRAALRERLTQIALDADLDLATDVFEPVDERKTIWELFGGGP